MVVATHHSHLDTLSFLPFWWACAVDHHWIGLSVVRGNWRHGSLGGMVCYVMYGMDLKAAKHEIHRAQW